MKKLILSALAAVAAFSAFANDNELVTNVATPTIDPDGGYFITVNGDVEVNISCETSGATIFYTIDGEEPNTTSDEYCGPFAISTDITETITISAIAVKDDNTSQIATATLNFCRPYESLSELLADVPLPEENKAYSDIFAVGFTSIVALAHGNYIYITDYESSYYSLIYKSGTGLTTGNMIYPYWLAKVQNYNGTYEIIPEGDFYGDTDATEPLEFEEIYDLGSVDLDKINHVVLLKEIQITEATPGPDATSTALNFNVIQNGNTYVFHNNFKIASTEPGTYDILAVVAQYNGELQFYPSEYRLPQTATPELSVPKSGLMEMPVVGDKFTLTCATEGATIYYTETEGGDWIEYTEPVTMEHNISIYAKATAPGHSDSEEIHFRKGVTVLAAEASASGAVAPGTQVTLSCATPGTMLFYGLFQNPEDLNSLVPTVYTEPITITEATNMLVASGFVADDWSDHPSDPFIYDPLNPNMVIFQYTLSNPVAAPQFVAPSGSGYSPYPTVGDKFTLTCETEGATIYYTETEGGDWIEYTEPVTMEHNISIYAKATAPGYDDSEVKHFTQTVCVKAPEASVSGDVYPGTRITLSCETPGTTFFYGFFKTEAELNNLMPSPYYGSIAIPETDGEIYLAMTSGILDENWDNVLTPDTNPYSDDILYPNMNIVAYTIKPYVTPDNLYIFGNIDGNNWDADQPLAFEKEGNVFTYCGTIDGASFGITEQIGSDTSTRWGGSLSDEQAINANEATKIVRSPNATMTLPQGSYKFEVTFTENLVTLTVSEWSGVDGIDADPAAETEYYNLQGVRVASPSDGGVYIIRRGNTVSKELVRKK
ncbi:MAG: chitobiase/beta-hexosaminidase C-terminal domain-containing protein [Muribaculaceae bacterium]